MEKSTNFVGLDVHAREIAVCLIQGADAARKEWSCGTSQKSIRKLGKRLLDESSGTLQCVYEAGPTGYGLARELVSMGVPCRVVAPSLTPVKPGDRIRTDRRDARKLAHYLRSGDLTYVELPTPDQEAAREICRRRTTVRKDRTRARHRLTQFLLRKGRVYRCGAKWTKKYTHWLRSQQFPSIFEEEVFRDLLGDLEVLDLRLVEWTQRVRELAAHEDHAERVGWLRCFRGFDTVSAMTLLVELFGIERFSHPRQLMKYLGLIPSENTTGASRRQGSITKQGNVHVRWLLVESAWHHRHPVRVSEVLKRRRRGQPPEVVALANRAMQRLHQRYYHLVVGRKMASQKAVVGLARESVGFLWAALVAYPQQLPAGPATAT